MINTDHWPLWLKYAIYIPHAILICVLLWLWWPKSNKSWAWAAGLSVYVLVVYLVILRSMKF